MKKQMSDIKKIQSNMDIYEMRSVHFGKIPDMKEYNIIYDIIDNTFRLFYVQHIYTLLYPNDKRTLNSSIGVCKLKNKKYILKMAEKCEKFISFTRS